MTRGGWLATLLAVVLLAAACSSTEPEPPVTRGGASAPVWLHVSQTTPDSIALGWTEPATVPARYEIFRSTRLSDGYVPLDTLEVGKVRFADKTVAQAQRYYYKVRGLDALGRSGEQTEPVWGVAVTNRAPEFSLEPGAIAPANGALGLVSVDVLQWTVTDADDEEVYCNVYYASSRADLEGAVISTANTGGQAALPSAPEFTRFYYWRVAASDASGTTTLSPYFSFGMRIEHVDVPSGYFVRGDCGQFFEDDTTSFCPDQRVVHVDDFNMDRYEVSNQLFAQYLQELKDGKYIEVVGGLVYDKLEPARHLLAKVSPGGDEDAGITFDPNQGVNGSFLPRPGRENHPVLEVTWHGAAGFAEYMGRALPTEVQWEKAARCTLSTFGTVTEAVDESTTVTVGVGTPYPWGDESDSRRYNYSGSGDPFDARVGVGASEVGFYDGQSHSGYSTRDGASAYGAHDLAGNVAEWCADTYVPYHGGANQGMMVIKGGGWRSAPIVCQVFWRQAAFPDSSDNNVGFRTVAPGLEGGR